MSASVQTAATDLGNVIQSGPAAAQTKTSTPETFPAATVHPAGERRMDALHFVYRELRIFHPSKGRVERFNELTRQ